MSSALNLWLPYLGLTVVEDIAYPITVTPPQMAMYWDQINASDAQITVPLVSSETGIIMMNQYQMFKPGCLVAGIDTHSQLENYWEDSSGACQYEIILQSVHNTNKTSKTLHFWNSFLYEFGEEPLYTGVGAYDSVFLLCEAVNETQSLNSDIIIDWLENYDRTNPFTGSGGNIAFTSSHDLYEGWPYSTSLLCQWTSYGMKEVISTYNLIYPDYITTGTLNIPYWGINNLTGPTPLPGSFVLSSDADVPDSDGLFNLTWSSSTGANSYSIFYSRQPTLERLIRITDNAISPYKVSSLKTDDYYFIVVAHNSVGEELSNIVHINVERPLPGSFTLSTDSADPNQNGQFNLLWTPSVGAKNYMVYGHNEYITEITPSLTLLADQSGISPHHLTGLMEGDYYFIVEALNESGTTLSNCLGISVDIPGPRPFVLSSDAGDPDQDGNFNLIWTEATGAENYSLYQHSSYITEINQSVTQLADQDGTSPFSVSGLTSGDYYFLAISYNATGNTRSNILYVLVQIPGQLPIIPGFNTVLFLMVISVISTIILTKLRKNLIKFLL
jgi:hypothetical protein